MKEVICDTCGTRTVPDAFGLAPHGSAWLSVSARKDYKTQDFCSTACAITALTPTAVVDVEVARMHDEGNPNDHDEAVF